MLAVRVLEAPLRSQPHLTEPGLQGVESGRQVHAGAAVESPPVADIRFRNDGQQRNAFAHHRQHLRGKAAAFGLQCPEAIGDNEVGMRIERLSQNDACGGYATRVDATRDRTGAEILEQRKTSSRVEVNEHGGVATVIATRSLDETAHAPAVLLQAVTGYGKSDKQAVANMVPRLVRLPALQNNQKRLDDEIDAIAVGLTCLASIRLRTI